MSKYSGNAHGDVRVESASEYYPLTVIGVGDEWAVVDLRKNIHPQLEDEANLFYTVEDAHEELRRR